MGQNLETKCIFPNKKRIVPLFNCHILYSLEMLNGNMQQLPSLWHCSIWKKPLLARTQATLLYLKQHNWKAFPLTGIALS